MTNQKEARKQKAEYERLTKQLRETCAMLQNTPAWDLPTTKRYVDDLFDQVIKVQDAHYLATGKRFF